MKKTRVLDCPTRAAVTADGSRRTKIPEGTVVRLREMEDSHGRFADSIYSESGEFLSGVIDSTGYRVLD